MKTNTTLLDLILTFLVALQKKKETLVKFPKVYKNAFSKTEVLFKHQILSTL